jgi:transketolase
MTITIYRLKACTELHLKRMFASQVQAYGWQVIGPVDGNDINAIASAIKEAQNEIRFPSLIICKTVIGCGSPNKEGKCSAHGEPLGIDEVALARTKLNWQCAESFKIPDDALSHFRKALDRGKAAGQDKWQEVLNSYQIDYPPMNINNLYRICGVLPANWDEGLDTCLRIVTLHLPTREASGRIINLIAPRIHSLVGGSADPCPSTKTAIKDAKSFGADCYSGRNFHFGIREHAMGAIANGMTLHGGLIPFVSTFLVFYDYMRAAIRLSAFMKQGVIYVFTHHSIGVGEDGPTHQPVEQLAGLRTVPGLVTIRPADATETAECLANSCQQQE